MGLGVLPHVLLIGWGWAQAPKPPSPPPDPRFKADVLLVVAHPDDESVIGSYLARIIYDERKRVAVIFGTRGDGDGNAAGYEQAASLGAVREMEGREALASFGVQHVWFLSGKDTPSQDVLYSLEAWGHGAAVEQTVRLTRLTRPEVVITWLPAHLIGENHGDHQAAGVIATEAFDLAADPASFPEQIATPRNRRGIGNLTEGLEPWQPKKLYYVSDAARSDRLAGLGPIYPSGALSPSQRVPYYQLAAKELSFHLTQGSEATVALEALPTGDFQPFLAAGKEFLGITDVQLVLGKSLVGGGTTGDVFEGIDGRVGQTSPRTAASSGSGPGSPVRLELAGPWGFYREFWRSHGIEHLTRVPGPEAGVRPGSTLRVALRLQNRGTTPADVDLTVQLPPGWRESSGSAPYRVEPGTSYPVLADLVAPSQEEADARPAVWHASVGGRALDPVTINLRAFGGAMPQ